MNDITKIGGNVEGTIVKELSSGQWEMSCAALPKGWSAILKSREAKLYEPKDTDVFWVFDKKSSACRIYLSDSDFGRFPISDRMRPRYTQALEDGLKIIASVEDSTSITPENLSELKGMFNRCVRKDQWDWLEVYRLFGMPSLPVLREAANNLGDLARSMKRGEAEQCERIVIKLREANLVEILKKAQKDLQASAPRLSNATTFRPMEESQDEEIPENIDKEDQYIVSQVARAKREQANAKHKETLNILVQFLGDNGFLAERSRLIDAFCRLKTGPAIFEVKSITASNERAQCRHALSQLYEYRYLHAVPKASLWVVLSSASKLDWVVEYLRNDRDVYVLWVERGDLGGPDFSKLLESGAASGETFSS